MQGQLPWRHRGASPLRVFADAALDTVEPDAPDVAGFDAIIQRFVDALPVERVAVDNT